MNLQQQLLLNMLQEIVDKTNELQTKIESHNRFVGPIYEDSSQQILLGQLAAIKIYCGYAAGTIALFVKDR